MKMKYVGQPYHSNMSLIERGILKPNEAFEIGKTYDIPEDLVNHMLEGGKFVKVNKKGDD